MKRKRSVRPAKAAKTSRPNIIDFGLGDYARIEGVSQQTVDKITAFSKQKGDRRLEMARQIIRDQIIDKSSEPDEMLAFAVGESESLLNGYATLDKPHRNEIQTLIDQIGSYLKDATRQRPLNVLMLATPGAGKSYFIKQLAAKMKESRVQAVTFNMATMRSADDMAQPIDELRNLKVNDRFPLLFLDEFDSDATRYAALLPLLWDGELHLGHRDLKLGKAVIVLAGSHPDLPKIMDRSAKMQMEGDGADHSSPSKLIDLLSRINGGIISIPDLELKTKDRDRSIDKVCATISLAKMRFGARLEEMPRAFLRFVAHTQFRYGVRSIAHLIDIINADALVDNKLLLTKLGLPLADESVLQNSSLKLHILDKDQAFGVIRRWNEFAADQKAVGLRKNRSLSMSFMWQSSN